MKYWSVILIKKLPVDKFVEHYSIEVTASAGQESIFFPKI